MIYVYAARGDRARVRARGPSPRRDTVVKTLAAHRAITVRSPFVESGQTAVALHLGYLFLLVVSSLWRRNKAARSRAHAGTPTRARARAAECRTHPRKCTVRAGNNGAPWDLHCPLTVKASCRMSGGDGRSSGRGGNRLVWRHTRPNVEPLCFREFMRLCERQTDAAARRDPRDARGALNAGPVMNRCHYVTERAYWAFAIGYSSRSSRTIARELFAFLKMIFYR